MSHPVADRRNTRAYPPSHVDVDPGIDAERFEAGDRPAGADRILRFIDHGHPAVIDRGGQRIHLQGDGVPVSAGGESLARKATWT